MNNQYLEVLQLAPGATETEIKKAYRILSKRHHPDVSKDEKAKEKFIEINEAYRFLTTVGPRPSSMAMSASAYDYDTRAHAYDEWRRSARVYAKKRAREAIRRQQVLTKAVLRGFDVLLIVIVAFNITLVIDKHLPLVPFSNEGMINQQITKTRTPQYDILKVDKYTLYLQFGTLDHLRGGRYENATVYTTTWYDKPLFLDLEIRGRQYRFEQYAGIYGFFSFFTNGILLLALLYRVFVRSLDSQLSVAILILFLSVFQLFIFLKY